MTPHLGDRRYVREVFDLIAPRYDRFTRWFSYGMDAAWKRDVEQAVVAALRGAGAATAVDLACGTGDLAERAARSGGRVHVVGIDSSVPMLEHAVRRRRDGAAIDYVAGDMAAIPLPDAAADLVTGGYALRNAPSLDVALDEIARVLRPGGHLVTLDFYLPASVVWRVLFLGYLRVAGWLFGWLWHRRPDAYVYIPRSIRRFVTIAAYERSLATRGLEVTRTGRRLLGGVAVHVARKAR